jgi:mono/diheme cytochrome c family protein
MAADTHRWKLGLNKEEVMGYLKAVGLMTALMFVVASSAVAEEKDPLKPRVPAEEMADAKAMKNPVPVNDANLAKGKALFEGKGTCFNCHGKEGKGDGRSDPESEPAELHELQIPQEAEGRRAVLGHQERQRRHRDGVAGSGHDHRGRGLDDHQLRAELLQEERGRVVAGNLAEQQRRRGLSPLRRLFCP